MELVQAKPDALVAGFGTLTAPFCVERFPVFGAYVQ